jgi:hypothetical protein
MARFILLTLILLVLNNSSPVYAEWVLTVFVEGKGGITVYVDPATIRRKGELVKMWHLYDFKVVQTRENISLLSLKEQREYDCAEERQRSLAITSFSGNMGRGNVVHINSDEEKWESVEPSSLGNTLWKVACKK